MSRAKNAELLESLRHRTRFTAEELRRLLPLMPSPVAHRVAALARALDVHADDAERRASLDLPDLKKRPDCRVIGGTSAPSAAHP